MEPTISEKTLPGTLLTVVPNPSSPRSQTLHSIAIVAISVITAFTTVALTSPNFQDLVHNNVITANRETLSLPTIQALLADISIASFLAVILTCMLKPRLTAEHHSFPYASRPYQNFGATAFDFQLLVFSIFHQRLASQIVHSIVITVHTFAWLVVIQGTFGTLGTALIVFACCAQGISFGDDVFAAVNMALHITLGVGAYTLYHPHLGPYDPLTILIIAKAVIFWGGMALTTNHAFEPLPPAYDAATGEIEPQFGEVAWTLLLKDPLKAFALMGLGLASEVEAGSPGRFISTILYKMMYHMGYRSKTLLDNAEAKRWSREVIERGWSAHPMTAEWYGWAAHGSRAGLVEKGESLLDQEGDVRSGGRRSFAGVWDRGC
jgi:hypothetical protein